MRKRKPNKLVVGLTGGFGTGKTTVARMLRSSGALVIDADKIGHDLLKPGSEVYPGIIRLFGRGIAGSSGKIDRRKLGGKVFSDRAALTAFNRLMHPAIIAEMKRKLKSASKRVVVLDAPLLLEKKLDRMADVVVVVIASLDNQIKRLRARTGLSKSRIIARIQSQIPLKTKLGRADFVIDNNGTIANTRKQVALIRRLWWRS